MFYITLPTENADQAISLTEYLNQHGIMAAREGAEMVTCPMDRPEIASDIYNLHRSWKRFWEYSDSGLWGLPLFIKNQ